MHRLIFAVLGLCAAAPTFALDDEAWIERHMEGVRIVAAPEPIVQRSAPKTVAVPLADLGKHVGQDITFVLDTGRERRGTIKSVDAKSITIVTKLHGGQAELEVPRVSIKSASKRS